MTPDLDLQHTEPLEEGVEPLRRKGPEQRRIRVDHATFTLRTNSCNRPNCNSCPHGPYWYREIQTPKGTRYRYIGKDLLAYLVLRWMGRVVAYSQDPELPGMPAISDAMKDDRPAWFPETLWRAVLQMMDKGETIANFGKEERKRILEEARSEREE